MRASRGLKWENKMYKPKRSIALRHCQCVRRAPVTTGLYPYPYFCCMTSHSDLSCCNSTLVERSLAIKLCIVDFSSCSPCLLVCNSTRNLLLSFSSWLRLPSARRLKQDMEWVNAIDWCGSIQFLFCRHMLLPANSRENLEGTVIFLERAVLQFLLLQLSAILTHKRS